MAALTAEPTFVLPLGKHTLTVWRASDPGNGQAAEWIATGADIDHVIGLTPIGATSAAVNVQMDADGTGVTEGDDPGSLGVEVAAASMQLEAVVIGSADGN